MESKKLMADVLESIKLDTVGWMKENIDQLYQDGDKEGVKDYQSMIVDVMDTDTFKQVVTEYIINMGFDDDMVVGLLLDNLYYMLFNERASGDDTDKLAEIFDAMLMH